MATQVASLYAKVGADTKPFDSAMRGVEGKLHGVGGAFASFGGVVTDVFKIGAVAAIGATTAAIAGLSAVVIKSTQSAADMEQQVANIAAVMGLTADETDKVSGLISDLGLDKNLKVSAVEAGQAIEMLAKNGLNLDEIMNGAARSTVLLANSTGAEFSSAADIASSAMSQFGIKAEDMNNAVNGIVGVTVASKFSLQDYGEAISQAGGVASALGVSFEDFNTTIAATSSMFGSGSDAGTSFKTFMQRLVPSTKEATKMMKQLGLMTEEGKNQFFDASGKMKSMSEITGLLGKAFGNLSEEQFNYYASNIFGSDSIRTVAGLVKMSTAEFDKLNESVNKTTDANASSAIRMNTFSGKMEIFRGIIESVSIGIGQKFLPMATRMLEWATDFLSANTDNIIEWFNRLADGIATVGQYLAAVWTDGDAQNDWLTHLPTAIQPAVKALGEFVGAMGRVWDAFQAGGLNAAFAQMGTELSALGKTIVTWVTSSETINSITGALAAWGAAFATWATGLWLTYVLPGLLSTWSNLVTWVTDVRTWGQIWQALTTWANTFGAWAAGLWAQYVQPELTKMWQSFAGPGGWIATNLPNMQPWIDVMAAFPKAVQDAWALKFPALNAKFEEWKVKMGVALGEFGAQWAAVFGDGSKPGTAADAAKVTVDVITKMFEGMMTGTLGLVKWATNVGKVVMLLKQLMSAIEAGDWGKAGDLFNQIDKIPVAPGFFNNPNNPLNGGIVNGGNPMTNPDWGAQSTYTPVTGGGRSAIDVYINNGSGMPADRDSLRQLAVALRKEMDLQGAVMVR